MTPPASSEKATRRAGVLLPCGFVAHSSRSFGQATHSTPRRKAKNTAVRRTPAQPVSIFAMSSKRWKGPRRPENNNPPPRRFRPAPLPIAAAQRGVPSVHPAESAFRHNERNQMDAEAVAVLLWRPIEQPARDSESPPNPGAHGLAPGALALSSSHASFLSRALSRMVPQQRPGLHAGRQCRGNRARKPPCPPGAPRNDGSRAARLAEKRRSARSGLLSANAPEGARQPPLAQYAGAADQRGGEPA